MNTKWFDCGMDRSKHRNKTMKSVSLTVLSIDLIHAPDTWVVAWVAESDRSTELSLKCAQCCSSLNMLNIKNYSNIMMMYISYPSGIFNGIGYRTKCLIWRRWRVITSISFHHHKWDVDARLVVTCPSWILANYSWCIANVPERCNYVDFFTSLGHYTAYNRPMRAV